MTQAMTKTYFAILHKDTDSAVGVVFPDLPGCFSAGDTYDEAIEKAWEALQLYAEAEQEAGRALPPPRSFEDLFAEREIRNEAAEAAFVAVPLGNSRQVVGLDRAAVGRVIHRDAATGEVVAVPKEQRPQSKSPAKARKKNPSAA